MEAIGTHEAALNSLLDEQVAGFEFNVLIRWDCADQRGETARREAIDTLLEHARITDRVEGVFDAAIAQAFDLANRINGRPR
jgi:hypothetical protein